MGTGEIVKMRKCRIEKVHIPHRKLKKLNLKNRLIVAKEVKCFKCFHYIISIRK